MKPARMTSILLAVFACGWLISCGSSGGNAGPPHAPQGVTATASDGSVTLQWLAVSGATSYNVYWSTASGVTVASGTQIAGDRKSNV